MSTPNTDDQPTRVCRRCSAESTTTGSFCPSCGSSYVRGSRRPSRKALVAGLVAVLLVAGVGSGIAVKRHQDAVDRDRVAAADAREAEQFAQDATDRKDAVDEAEREQRRTLVMMLEERITKDAKDLVTDGTLDGPIEYSSCTATGGGSDDDLTALTGTFDCMAVNKENDDGTVSGYSYQGTAEWSTGSITWIFGR